MTAVEERTAQTLAVEVSRDEIAEAVTFASAVAISKRCPLPVLAGVKISAASGVGTVEAFDYETHAVQTIAARGEGSALVNAKALLDIIKGCDKGVALTLTVDGSRLVVGDGTATFTVATLDIDEHPRGPLPAPLPVGTFDKATVTGVLDIIPAAGRDDKLPVLTGMCFDPQGTWHAATTDRYRLAVYDTGQPVSADARRFIVSCATLRHLSRLSGDVTVTYEPSDADNGHATFTDGTRTITTRTIYGEFPKYRVLIPDTFTATATVEAKPFVKAVKRAAIVARRTAPVLLNLNGQVTVEAGNEYDDQTASVPAGGTYTGDPMTVGANPAYLLDMIAGVGGASVTIGFTASCKPFVAFNPERPQLRWLQMPVRLAS